MLDGITPVHLVIVLVVALLILGPGKLPETGAALGKAVRDFRHGLSDDVTTPAAGTGGLTGTNPSPRRPCRRVRSDGHAALTLRAPRHARWPAAKLRKL